MSSKTNIYTVKQVNSYIKGLLEDDFILRNIFVRGELSNCKYHSTGHVYFSLKDEVEIHELPLIIACHIGPGALACACCNK